MLKRHKEIFEALPHVQEMWVTADGEFHLHPHNGGEKIERNQEDVIEIKEEIKPEIKVKEAAKITLKDSDKATETVLNLHK